MAETGKIPVVALDSGHGLKTAGKRTPDGIREWTLNDRVRDRGVKRANWAVINQNRIPAVLVEGGFMDSNIDYNFITSDAGQDAYARAVAEGLVEFLALEKKETAPNASPGTAPETVPAVLEPAPATSKEGVKYRMNTLKKGNTGNDVTIFESIMKKMGYYTGKIDTSFGSGCVAATNAFQKDYPECGTNGQPDGSFGPKCWNKALSLIGA